MFWKVYIYLCQKFYSCESRKDVKTGLMVGWLVLKVIFLCRKFYSCAGRKQVGWFHARLVSF